MYLNVPDEYELLFSTMMRFISQFERCAVEVAIIPDNDFRKTMTIYENCDTVDKQMISQRVMQDWMSDNELVWGEDDQDVE